MKLTWIYLLIGGLLVICVSCNKEQNDPNKEEWISLFNGKDLNDWQVKITGHELNDNFANTFRVADGVMHRI